MYYVIPSNSSLFSRIKVFVPAGNLWENKNENGISHVLEHILTENKLANKGIKFNANTSNNNVIYDIAGNSKYFSEMLQFLEKILDPEYNKIKENDIIVAKSAVKEELLNHLNDPLNILVSEVYKNLYNGPNKYVYDIPNKIKNLEKITKNDIEKFFKRMYDKSKMIFILYGKIKNLDGIKGLKGLKGLEGHENLGRNIENIRKLRFGPIKEIKIPNIKKTNFIVAYKCIPKDYENTCIYQDIIKDLLCGTIDSILYKKLRTETNLIYEITLSFEYSAKDNILLSIFQFSTSFGNDKLLELFFNEMEKFISGDFKNLDLSKEKIITFDEDISKNSSFLCNFYGHQLITFGKCISYKEYINKIKSIKHKELTSIIKEFFTDNIVIKSIK